MPGNVVLRLSTAYANYVKYTEVRSDDGRAVDATGWHEALQLTEWHAEIALVEVGISRPSNSISSKV